MLDECVANYDTIKQDLKENYSHLKKKQSLTANMRLSFMKRECDAVKGKTSGQKNALTAGFMAMATLLSKVLGLVRDSLLTAYFGSGLSRTHFNRVNYSYNVV